MARSSTFNNPRDYFHFDNETNFIKAFTKNIFLKIDWSRYSKANFRILVLYPIFFSIETLSFSNWSSSSHANKNLLCYFTNIEVSDCHSVENFEFFYPSDFTWNQLLPQNHSTQHSEALKWSRWQIFTVSNANIDFT